MGRWGSLRLEVEPKAQSGGRRTTSPEWSCDLPIQSERASEGPFLLERRLMDLPSLLATFEPSGLLSTREILPWIRIKTREVTLRVVNIETDPDHSVGALHWAGAEHSPVSLLIGLGFPPGV